MFWEETSEPTYIDSYHVASVVEAPIQPSFDLIAGRCCVHSNLDDGNRCARQVCERRNARVAGHFELDIAIACAGSDLNIWARYQQEFFFMPSMKLECPIIRAETLLLDVAV